MRFARNYTSSLREAPKFFLLCVICDLLCVICVILFLTTRSDEGEGGQ
jgi:hypothetical protein